MGGRPQECRPPQASHRRSEAVPKKALIAAGCTMPDGSIIHDPFETAELFAT